MQLKKKQVLINYDLVLINLGIEKEIQRKQT